MTPEEAFGLQLIAAEEAENKPQPTEAQLRQREELVIIQRRDFTETTGFHINEPGITMPIEGPGTLKNVAVMADVKTFEVYLEVDGQVVVSESLDQLLEDADEYNRVSAYEKGPEWVFTASDYPFQQSVDCVITPTESTTFDLQRAEVDVIREELVEVV